MSAFSFECWSAILCKHDYPSNKEEKATQTVMEQATLLSAE